MGSDPSFLYSYNPKRTPQPFPTLPSTTTHSSLLIFCYYTNRDLLCTALSKLALITHQVWVTVELKNQWYRNTKMHWYLATSCGFPTSILCHCSFYWFIFLKVNGAWQGCNKENIYFFVFPCSRKHFYWYRIIFKLHKVILFAVSCYA